MTRLSYYFFLENYSSIFMIVHVKLTENIVYEHLCFGKHLLKKTFCFILNSFWGGGAELFEIFFNRYGAGTGGKNNLN